MKLVIDFVHYCCHSLYLAPVFAIFSYNIFYELYKYKIAKLSKNIWIWICQCSVWLSIVNSISLVERRGWLCQNGWSAKYSAWNENHMVSARPINFRHTRVYWIYWKSTLGIFFLQHSIWRPLLENELKTKSMALENHWRSQESKIFGGRQLWVVSSPLTVFSRC